MNKLIVLVLSVVIFTSCEKNEFERPTMDYHFDMVGRCQQDINGYYHLSLIEGENQTLHRFGANITNTDIYNLPSQVFWSCESYWEFDNNTVPIVNRISFADPNVDSVFCMMAPVWEMRGDTVTIYGEAWFEEGDIVKYDEINIILE
tara:strand:- start:83 stop:523 length:441 start_codon:yes stop_codon:yes gene_type:complete